MRLGKFPVVVGDSPGFLVNRCLGPYLDEAARLLLEGTSPAAIDGAEARLRAAYPVARLVFLEPDLYRELPAPDA